MHSEKAHGPHMVASATKLVPDFHSAAGTEKAKVKNSYGVADRGAASSPHALYISN